jgi:hypothetical protein
VNKIISGKKDYINSSLSEKLRFKSKSDGETEENNDILVNSILTDQIKE